MRGHFCQLVDLPTDALLSHNGASPPSFHPPPVPPISPYDPATYYQVVVEDANHNNNNYGHLKVARRPLSVIHEESLFNHFL